MAYTLYIGNKNYSSWSLRPWVLMKTLGIDFHEARISLYAPRSKEDILAVSPSGKVPCLHDDSIVVWDTLAIAEYLADNHAGVWPTAAVARAWARSATAEMHSGFAALRNQFSMNLRLSTSLTPSAETAADIARIEALWSEGRHRFGADGPYLCGAFSAVDAFFCPVAFRFASYGVAHDGELRAYRETLLDLPAMRQWAADAALENERIAVLDSLSEPVQR